MEKTYPKVVRILVGLLFISGGAFKAYRPAEGVLALMALDFPDQLAGLSISLIAALELYLGTLLVARITPRFTASASIGLLAAFTLYLWYLTTMASPPSCGCPDLTGLMLSNKQKALVGILRNICLISFLWHSHFSESKSVAVNHLPGQHDMKGLTL